MIHATFRAPALTAAGADPTARTITGVAVPYGVPGIVASGDTVIFEPGSLDPAARPIALRDHDRTRPIGVVVDAVDHGPTLDATMRVSRTADGDEALVLAADGALPAFSVGADPTDYHFDADGVMHVVAADWQELSLLTFGAYRTARVASVTAQQGEPNMPTVTATVDPVDPELDPELAPELDPELDPDTATDDPPETVEAGARPVPITAGRRPGRLTVPAHPYAAVGLRDISRMLNAAAADPRTAAHVRRIMTSPGSVASPVSAALVDVTLVGTNNVGPMQRPGYQAELVEIVTHGSPTIEVLRQGDLERGDFPNKTFNQWTLTPQVALQTAEKAEIFSAPVAIGPVSVPVQTWATGNDLSQQLLDFGSPSFVEDYIRAAGVDYAEVSNLYAVTALLAAATPATVAAGATFIDVVGALFGALNVNKVPAGGFFLAVSWDQWVTMIGVKEADGPAFWNGSISFGNFLPTTDAGGLSIYVESSLPAGTYLLGMRAAATWYDLPGTPFSLRAVNVGQLGLDVGVYGYGALGVQYPFALAKATVPPV